MQKTMEKIQFLFPIHFKEIMEKLSFDFGCFAKKHGLVVVTAESCTAGLISSTIAMTPGSSQWLDRGFVVYTAEAKNEVLGVNLDTIKKYNITSEQVAKEMVLGALKNSKANLALAVTGLAGPIGGTNEIPVGTVCMAWKLNKDERKMLKTQTKLFTGNRNSIREQVVEYMLKFAMEMIE